MVKSKSSCWFTHITMLNISQLIQQCNSECSDREAKIHRRGTGAAPLAVHFAESHEFDVSRKKSWIASRLPFKEPCASSAEPPPRP